MMAKASDRNRADQVHDEAGAMSPDKPYTGDGRTTRDIYDKPESVQRTPDGRRQR
jgi:hypothetical protein